MKYCPHCGSEKPVGYRSSWCRSCKTDHEMGRRAVRRRRNATYKYKYGITVDDYDVMLENQNGVCAICNRVDMQGIRLAVDHDHDTKEVRGLLCAWCNVQLAWFDKYRTEILAYLGA